MKLVFVSALSPAVAETLCSGLLSRAGLGECDGERMPVTRPFGGRGAGHLLIYTEGMVRLDRLEFFPKVALFPE